MVFCMNYLIEKPQEEKLECLCNLLTTIGEQVESEATEQLHNIIIKMQDIVNDRKNKISSRVRFMIQVHLPIMLRWLGHLERVNENRLTSMMDECEW